MTLTAGDELLHRPPAGVEHWQENMFFICWDVDRNTGLLCHVQRVPDLGIQAVQAVVAIDGAFASATVDTVSAEPVEPFRRWRVGLDVKGTMGRDDLGFLAAGPADDTPFGCDLILESELPVVDFAAALAEIVAGMRGNSSFPQMGDQQHYEQGGTFHGRLWIDSTEREVSGLFVRDHSWGERHETSDFRAFWTASCLDDGRMFCNAIGIPTGGRALGIGAVATPDGVTFTSHVSAYFGPAPGIATYDRTAVAYGPPIDRTLAATTLTHIPIPLPHSGAGRYDNNAISTVRMGDATGFGVMEWASVLKEDR